MSTKHAKNLVVRYAERPHPVLGLIWAGLTEHGLWAVDYGIDEMEFLARIQDRGPVAIVHDPQYCDQALEQIVDYLDGKRRRFDLSVDWSGMTDFQIAVRKAVMAVPYGEISSYGEIAAQVGNPRAARAVGSVQAANPLMFVIPCHRIVHADGTLANYGGQGGVDTKTWLLRLEGRSLPKG